MIHGMPLFAHHPHAGASLLVDGNVPFGGTRFECELQAEIGGINIWFLPNNLFFLNTENPAAFCATLKPDRDGFVKTVFRK
jgi:hypothetical protein